MAYQNLNKTTNITVYEERKNYQIVKTRAYFEKEKAKDVMFTDVMEYMKCEGLDSVKEKVNGRYDSFYDDNHIKYVDENGIHEWLVFTSPIGDKLSYEDVLIGTNEVDEVMKKNSYKKYDTLAFKAKVLVKARETFKRVINPEISNKIDRYIEYAVWDIIDDANITEDDVKNVVKKEFEPFAADLSEEDIEAIKQMAINSVLGRKDSNKEVEIKMAVNDYMIGK